MHLIYRGETVPYSPSTAPRVSPRAMNWRYQGSIEMSDEISPDPQARPPLGVNWRYQSHA